MLTNDETLPLTHAARQRPALNGMRDNLQVNEAFFPGRLAATFLSAERQIALLSRCRPLNWDSELARLASAWCVGNELTPQFTYADPVRLSPLREWFAQLDALLEQFEWGALYRARLGELELEARMAEVIGTPHMVALSRQRYRDGFEQAPALELAHSWIQSEKPLGGDDYVGSDDLADPGSLVRRVQAWVGQTRIPFRVLVSAELVSLAATGEDFIVVAKHRRLHRLDVDRIAVHEVFGHALPRAMARHEPEALFTIGAAGGGDVQEGYAVHCERAHGVLHSTRRAELGFRHLAATTIWEGADFVDTVRLLRAHGADVDRALRICLRAHRAGGLGREGAYLPAFCVVTSAIERDAEMAAWLGAGRLSLSAIDVLRRGGYQLAARPKRSSGLLA